MTSKVRIILEDILLQISKERIKDYQKDYIRKIVTDKKLDLETFSKLRNIDSIDKFFKRRDDPSLFLDSFSMFFTNRLLSEKIKSLNVNDRINYIFESYFKKEVTEYDKVYDHVLKTISDILEVYGKDPSLINKIKDLEPLMQDLPRYRDHFIHSFNVFILGYYILYRLNKMNPNLFTKDHADKPILSWMLTSTFHDIAYPIQEIDYLLNTFFSSFIGINPAYSINVRDIIPNIYYDFLKIICNWHKNPKIPSVQNMQNLDLTFYNIVNAKLIQKDHGVISSLILLHLLGIRQDFFNSENQDFIYVHLPACHSICLHTLDLKIDFTKHPLAFLLILCDEIQDWGRPTKKSNRELIYLEDIKIIKLEIPEIHFVVAISENRKIDLARVLSHRLKTSGKIKIKIKDIDGEEVLDI